MTAVANTAPAQIAALQAALNAARTDLSNAEGFVSDTRYGVHRPLFTDATTGLTSPSGLSVGSGSAGLIASVAGVAGTAFIDLPAEVDYTKPWRSAILIQTDVADDGATNYFQCTLGRGPNAVSDENSRGLDIYVQSGYISVKQGGNNSLMTIIPTLAGQKYWVGACSDGVQVAVFAMPYNHGGIQQSVTAGGTGQFEGLRVYPYTTKGYNSAFDSFSRQKRIWLSNKSTNIRLLGAYFNMAGTFETSGQVISPTGYAGGSDTRMQPPANLAPVYGAGWDGALVRIPKSYDGRTPTDLIYIDHPNASDEWVQSRYNDTDTGRWAASLVNSGYMLAYRNGAYPLAYSGKYNSPWGGADGLAKRKEMIDDIRLRFPMIRHIYWVGLSQGCLNGLVMHRTYPTLLRAFVGISGVTNMTYAHDSEGFSSVISTGWNAADWASVIQPNDPNLTPSSFSTLPIKIWHSTSDTTVHKTQHADLFKSNVEAAGGTVTVTAVTGSGHLTDVGLFDGPAINTFFQSV